MSRVLTGDKLVESIRLRAFIPNDTATYTDQDILNVANEEMDVQLLDKLLSLHEEHLTVHVDIPRNSSGVYEIPYRAIGNKVRDVSLITAGQVYELAQVSIGELSDYSFTNATIVEDLDKFYIESNFIKILQPSRSYDHIRIHYYIRPSVITKMEKAGTILSLPSLNQAGTAYTVQLSSGSIPKTFTASMQFDIVGKKTPNKIKVWDLQPLTYNNNTGTFTFKKEDLDPYLNEIIVGDYVCQAEESPVPNIPTEMHPVLAQLAAVHILESLGDSEGLGNAERRLNKLITSTTKLVDARVELAPKKIKPRHGTLQQSIGGYIGRRRR